MDRINSRGRSPSQNALSNYRMGKTLGIGAFGKVKLALHTLTGVKVAIKILERQSINELEAEKVKREIHILRLLSHPHIVRLYQVIETRSTIYMVMEYMNRGELFDYLIEKVRLDEDEARHFFQQIISGLECFHLHKVVHRDLKPENLLLDSRGNVKIADFGLGNIMRDGHFLKTCCGSPNYAAPEVISERLYAGPEVDVWSCGVILYALLCGRLPFDDDNLSGLYSRIRNGIYMFPNCLSHGARDLITRILIVDPVNRISIPEMHRHPWFQQCLPRYIAIRSTNTLFSPTKIDDEILQEMRELGFDTRNVIQSLQNLLQNEVTVSYSLLLHKRVGVDTSQFLESLPQTSYGRPGIYVRSAPPMAGSWALGFKSSATPSEAMADVLRFFESMDIRWKKIGHYNLKCLWLAPVRNDPIPTSSGQVLSTPTMSKSNLRSQDAVKFEIQLYRAREDLYVLDLQRLHGPPFLFLEICARFRVWIVS